MFLLLAVRKHGQIRVKVWILIGDPHPESPCGPLWGIGESPDYASASGWASPTLLLPLSQPCRVLACAFLCTLTPFTPTHASPLLEPCAGPALTPSLTLFLSLPLLSCVLVTHTVIMSVPIPPSPALPPVPFPCSLEGLHFSSLCPETCSPPEAACQSCYQTERHSGWLSPKARPVEARGQQGSSCPAPSCPVNGCKSLEMLCSLSK